MLLLLLQRKSLSIVGVGCHLLLKRQGIVGNARPLLHVKRQSVARVCGCQLLLVESQSLLGIDGHCHGHVKACRWLPPRRSLTSSSRSLGCYCSFIVGYKHKHKQQNSQSSSKISTKNKFEFDKRNTSDCTVPSSGRSRFDPLAVSLLLSAIVALASVLRLCLLWSVKRGFVL